MLRNALMKLYLCLAFLPAAVFAADVDSLVAGLQQDWAVANYELEGDRRIEAFEALVGRADAAVAAHPESADVLIWNGIIKSTYAGVKGGLGALSLAKAARKSLEAALQVDDRALDGSA